MEDVGFRDRYLAPLVALRERYNLLSLAHGFGLLCNRDRGRRLSFRDRVPPLPPERRHLQDRGQAIDVARDDPALTGHAVADRDGGHDAASPPMTRRA